MTNPNPIPHLENLKTPTSEKAREYGRKGGLKSQANQREKKLISQIYFDVLAKKYKINDKILDLDELIPRVILKALIKGDNNSISMLKEIRESTEGSKVITDINHGLSDSVLDKIPIDEIIKIARKAVGIPD